MGRLQRCKGPFIKDVINHGGRGGLSKIDVCRRGGEGGFPNYRRLQFWHNNESFKRYLECFVSKSIQILPEKSH